MISEEETATVSEADEGDTDDQAPTKYNYMIRYCDRDTGALLMTQTGSAYADSVLTAIQAPSGYVLADHDPFVITAGTGHGVNTFTAWCIDKQYVKPEGYVDYTIDCVDAAGNIIKTFTDSAKSGSTIRPHYEIYGYDMDTKRNMPSCSARPITTSRYYISRIRSSSTSSVRQISRPGMSYLQRPWKDGAGAWLTLR